MTLERANQFLQLKDYYSAEQEYKNLLRVNTSHIEAIWGLGRVALAKNDYKRAYDLFVRCLHLNANVCKVYLSLAEACSALTQFDKTEAALLSAYKIQPNSSHVLYALSVYYCEKGYFDKSEAYANTLLNIDKYKIKAFSILVRMKKLTIDLNSSEFFKPYFELLKSNNVSTTDKVLLNYSFADLYHHHKEYSLAFTFYEAANRLQRGLIEFSVEAMLPSIELLIGCFDISFVQKFSSISPSAINLTSQINITPIFIVGQPRSGSTLLEQMLIGHNEIVSAGELPHIGDDVVQGVMQMTKDEFPLGCKSLNQEQCLTLALHYLNNLKDISGGQHRYVIDKMPANFQFIGLIKLILPHAKIIHIERDPKDVSWSIYRNGFDALEPHFCSQSEIAQYHHIYKNVMSHWGEVLPHDICNIQYEELVDEPEKELTKVLSFCCLDFDKACLNFSDKNRMIKTLSDTQLRHGIQKREVADWLPYKDELKSMFELLK